jgi:hypothetical protein
MAIRFTQIPFGLRAYPRDARAENKSAAYTTVAGDEGKTLLCRQAPGATAIIITLSVITAVDGSIITIVNDSDDFTILTIDPNAGDYIAWANNVADGTTIINTAATALRGDYLILGAHAATHWSVLGSSGIWAVGS